MANYHSLKNSSIIVPVSNTDLGSPSNKYGNLYMSGNISLNGTTLNSTNAVAPRVSAISYGGDDTATDSAGGKTITVNGSGFGAGASVYVGGTIVGVTTVVNSTQVTFVAPAKTAGNYSLAVVNADGASALYVSGLQYSGVPAWSTAAGTLGSVAGSASGSFTVAATSDTTVTYSVYSGTLPTGFSLNASSGVISGTAGTVGNSTVYNFTIRATDAEKQDTDRNFSITVTAVTSVDYIVVAGGGAGGTNVGGGGGAGGMIVVTGFQAAPGTPYTVTIGAGGVAFGDNGSKAASGGSSTFGPTTSSGGGGGANQATSGAAGGSGGGGGWYGGQAGGAGTAGQGNAGAASTGAYYAGGGGGKGAASTSATGGAGYEWPTASGNYYAVGGNGGGGVAQPANTGNGGNGSDNGSGHGGSGVVILRYSDISPTATSTTGSPTVTVAGGYRTYKFTASGSITF